MSARFDPSVSWEAVRWLREMWPRKLVVKGPIAPGTAERLIDLGVDGIHLSNHGGRQSTFSSELEDPDELRPRRHLG